MKKLLFYILALLIAIACFGHFGKEKKSDGVRTEKKSYSGWHLLVTHNQGGVQEDPDGCPCACLMLGWSSYANMTNAAAHGILSSFDEAKKRDVVSTNGLVSLVAIGELEEVIISEIGTKKGGGE